MNNLLQLQPTLKRSKLPTFWNLAQIRKGDIRGALSELCQNKRNPGRFGFKMECGLTLEVEITSEEDAPVDFIIRIGWEETFSEPGKTPNFKFITLPYSYCELGELVLALIFFRCYYTEEVGLVKSLLENHARKKFGRDLGARILEADWEKWFRTVGVETDGKKVESQGLPIEIEPHMYLGFLAHPEGGYSLALEYETDSVELMVDLGVGIKKWWQLEVALMLFGDIGGESLGDREIGDCF